MQVVPILRAGLILMEQAATLLPVTQTYHVGYVRDDQTLEVCACCTLVHCLAGPSGVPFCPMWAGPEACMMCPEGGGRPQPRVRMHCL